MDSEIFNLSGPLHVPSGSWWKNEDHERSVVASLVQGVYTLERDRRKNRKGSDSLAPEWWEFFHLNLHSILQDENKEIFGAIYEFHQSSETGNPLYVIAFRGTLTINDMKLNIRIMKNSLHKHSRFQIAIQAVQDIARNNSSVWLAGHSLGSAMAMLAGKHMAKTEGILLKSFLFNPPYVSLPIEIIIKNEKVKHGVRIVKSGITDVVSKAVKHYYKDQSKGQPFDGLKEWVPCLFVNPCDTICAEYIGYFKHRKFMEENGLGGLERRATQHSIYGSIKSLIRKKSVEAPFHRIPSANLTVNLNPSHDDWIDHGIRQWWRSDLNLKSETYKYL